MKKISLEKIIDKTFPNERDLYNHHNLYLENVRFSGVEDGESALKESSNLVIKKCFFDLRYPLWRVDNASISDSEFTENSRAAIWYSNNILISNSKMYGIKALRECKKVTLLDVDVKSPEFLWKSYNIVGNNLNVESEYFLLESNYISLTNLNFKGKYSFQYTKNLMISNSNLDTKDCFWHSENVVIRNSIVKGEYLAWYSKNLTFINCEIIGTQPFCYTKNLKLINCTMKDCDLSFEYSKNIKADINSNITSIKNPISGEIRAKKIDKIILTNDSKYPCKCKIIEK